MALSRSVKRDEGVKKTVILGLGNLLMGDEGVGIHVIRRLEEMELPPRVELVDGGTAGLDLLPILDQADRAIIVDAVRAGGEPGSIYRFGPEDIGREPLEALSLHQVSLQEVWQAARWLNIEPETVVIGVEPKRIAPSLELSEQLRATLPRIIEAIHLELQRWGSAHGIFPSLVIPRAKER